MSVLASAETPTGCAAASRRSTRTSVSRMPKTSVHASTKPPPEGYAASRTSDPGRVSATSFPTRFPCAPKRCSRNVESLFSGQATRKPPAGSATTSGSPCATGLKPTAISSVAGWPSEP